MITYSKKVILPIIVVNLVIFLTGTMLYFVLDQTSIIKDSILITAVALFALVSVLLISLVEIGRAHV